MASMPTAISMLWPDEAKGPWVVKIWWRVQHRTATPVGLELTSWQHDDWDPEIKAAFRALPEPDAEEEFVPIGSQLIKTLPVGQLLNLGRRVLLDMLDSDELPAGWSEDDREYFDAEHAEFRDEFGPALAGGARSARDLGDAHYAEVASVYAAAVREGRPPTAAVAAHFTLSKSAAAKQVARARERDFLPKTTRGRVGKLSKEI